MTQHNIIQEIIFGNPGTGKSHSIDADLLPELGIDDEADVIKTVFHPEYTYGDFMGKLLPTTENQQVRYDFYPGHLLIAMGRAIKHLIEADATGVEPQHVALVIDEINRGNSAAIFGTAFQLLDRRDDGFSAYQINLSKLEFDALVAMLEPIKKDYFNDSGELAESGRDWIAFDESNPLHRGKKQQKLTLPHDELPQEHILVREKHLKVSGIDLKNRKVRLPRNLSIIGTMNTSDNSIYLMDSAFKRRWGWRFVDWEDRPLPPVNHPTLDEPHWKRLVRNLNYFLKEHHLVIRGIEDKQVGYYFIKTWSGPDGYVTSDDVRNKLMFFVWDSVFQRDKRPLLSLINEGGAEVTQAELVTFGDFCQLYNEFINALLNRR